MDSQKPSRGSASPSRGSARHDSTPSSSNLIHSVIASQPSLPSIRQLHPYLPPSGLSQRLGEGSSLMYSAPPQLAPNSPAQSIFGSRKSAEMFAMDSEPEVVEQSCEPPKKKRRRQALSCTECKRRKIKCDRTQPCTPCTRRGEQSRCQWHVVEPVEKYVTRAEFDDLKARYDELFEQVQRLQRGTLAPHNHMGLSPGLQGAEAVSSTGSLGYPPTTSPSQSLNPSTQIQSSQRFVKPQDTQTQSHQHLNTVATSPSLTRSPSSVRPSLSDNSPTSSVAKTSPFSLASIISPSNQDSRSKNCYAQTLVLGKRLRPESQDSYVPAAHFSGMTLRIYRLSQGQERILIISHLPVRRVRRTRRIRHLEGSWNHHFKPACHHEMMAGSH